MNDVTESGLPAQGWSILEDDGFIGYVGPLWHRVVDGRREYAIEGQRKHRNRRGLVQGGLLMTLADRTCGMTARYESGAEHLATIQMDTHFIDAARQRQVVFIQCDMRRRWRGRPTRCAGLGRPFHFGSLFLRRDGRLGARLSF